jgi:hypothetical protein
LKKVRSASARAWRFGFNDDYHESQLLLRPIIQQAKEELMKRKPCANISRHDEVTRVARSPYPRQRHDAVEL